MAQDNPIDGEIESDLDGLRGALEEEKKRAEENIANLKRAYADFANYRRRAESEKSEATATGKALALMAILPVLDDLSRAATSVPLELKGNQWADGLLLIEKKFRDILEKEGVKPIKTVGEPFDPCKHEAVMRCAGEEGLVVAEFKLGFIYGERVLRPAQVSVGCAEEDD